MALLINGSIPKSITYNNQIVKKIKFNGNIVWQESRLPNDYQEVEWIESTGSQYIDTNQFLNQSSGFYIDFIPENDVVVGNSPNYINAGGAGGNSYNRVSINVYPTSRSGELQFFDLKTDPKITKNQRIKMSIINSKITYNDGTTADAHVNDRTTASSLIIFASYDRTLTTIQRFSKMKLYNFKLYNSSEVIKDYVPCYRISDGVIGLYDLIDDEFKINQGTGIFNKGEDI